MARGKAGPPPEDPRDVETVRDPQKIAAAMEDTVDLPKRDPVTHPAIEFHREFRRHQRTGQIFAVELAGGVLNGVLELTKPEEMTHGALPVLALSADLEPYKEVAGWCQAWEPKHTPESAVRRMAHLEEEVQTLDKKIEDLGTRKAKLSKDREQKIAEIRRLIQQANVGQNDLLAGVPAEPVSQEAQQEVGAELAAAPAPDVEPVPAAML